MSMQLSSTQDLESIKVCGTSRLVTNTTKNISHSCKMEINAETLITDHNKKYKQQGHQSTIMQRESDYNCCLSNYTFKKINKERTNRQQTINIQLLDTWNYQFIKKQLICSILALCINGPILHQLSVIQY
ncbi:Hypothetical_protein [Hexamita inflata]|uniref:Hypothetical_protein n=1 Tax=Hexamita inflata TaxID=28002 RepID=A0ABP1JU71_9EUKA